MNEIKNKSKSISMIKGLILILFGLGIVGLFIYTDMIIVSCASIPAWKLWLIGEVHVFCGILQIIKIIGLIFGIYLAYKGIKKLI
ncbi:TPA_asm: hypothetical protein [Altiarchaeum virus]|nr:MAG: hypothetical protein BWK75_01165 [Candidatus Altiarchaeales archaeon A3]DAZ85518.1 TPA_asm: hypothetical protein [Altiarchaeum virus]